MPSATSSGNLPCTLFPLFDNTGSMMPSRSGKALTFSCWEVESQVGLGVASFPAASYPRVVAQITQDGHGVVDTTEGCTDCYTNNQVTWSAYLDDTLPTKRFWMSGSAGSTAGGIHTFPSGSTYTTTPYNTVRWSRALPDLLRCHHLSGHRTGV